MRWLHALVECAGLGNTHLRGAALPRIRVIGSGHEHIIRFCMRLASRKVGQSLTKCAFAMLRGPRASVERLPCNADRRVVKQIALARCALTLLAATFGINNIASHCRVERRTRR